MVGRFVEQQQVGLLPGDQRQRQARLLAAGEIQYRLVAAVATEVETAEEIAQGLLALTRGNALQVQQRAGLGVQRVELVLGEVANGEILAALQMSGEQFEIAGEGLDQGRLAGAVGTEQADPRARSELQLDLLQHGLVAVAETRLGHVQQRAGNLVRLAEAEVERRIDVRRRQFLQALQRLDAALRLARLGRLRLEAGDELFHVRALRLLLLVGLLLLRQAFGAGALEGRIAAAVEGQLALLEVRHVIDHTVEEIAVVGDQQEGAGVAFQPVLEPEDGVQVEVVGRLVEQQQLGRAHQRLGQVQAHPPAAGEVADAAVHLVAGEAETGQQLARTGVRRVAVGTVQLNVQTGDSGAVVARFGRSQLALNLAQVLIAVEHVVHGQAFQVVHFLAHMGNAPIGRQQAVASIGPELAAQQGEQAGFAGTVGADETDLLAGVQGQFSAF
ncbi:hypothetical protein D9M69_408900 [compost metagenome]